MEREHETGKKANGNWRKVFEWMDNAFVAHANWYPIGWDVSCFFFSENKKSFLFFVCFQNINRNESNAMGEKAYLCGRCIVGSSEQCGK